MPENLIIEAIEAAKRSTTNDAIFDSILYEQVKEAKAKEAEKKNNPSKIFSFWPFSNFSKKEQDKPKRTEEEERSFEERKKAILAAQKKKPSDPTDDE